MRQLGCGRVSLSSRCTGSLWEPSLEAQQGKRLSLSAEKMWPGYEEKEENPKKPSLAQFLSPSVSSMGFQAASGTGSCSPWIRSVCRPCCALGLPPGVPAVTLRQKKRLVATLAV